jgi:hypothetical protein
MLLLLGCCCRALAGVEAALDARESQLQDSWQLLQASAAALKNGDVAGAATASAIVGMVRNYNEPCLLLKYVALLLCTPAVSFNKMILYSKHNAGWGHCDSSLPHTCRSTIV